MPNALEQAIDLHRQGELDAAEKIYRDLLATRPRHADALHLLGVLQQQRGNHAEALRLISQAIRLQPKSGEFFNNYGAALEQDGKAIEAYACYWHALELKPNYVDALSNLARVQRFLGFGSDADETERHLLQLDPRHLGSLVRRAETLLKSGEWLGAEQIFQQAVAIDPSAQYFVQLGNIRMALGSPAEAAQHYQQAIAKAPQNAAAHYNLGSALAQQELLEESSTAFAEAARLRPQHSSWKYRAAALVPAVFSSSDEVQIYRAELLATLDRALARHETFALKELSTSGFFPSMALAYHGCCARELKQKFAALFAQSFPQHRQRKVRAGRKRIGFVVTAQHEGIFLRNMGGLVERLDARRFESVILCSEAAEPMLRRNIASSAVQFVAFPNDLEQAMERIASAECDLLYYWEIGSDSMNYFLPFARLAPVQCTSWGSQITTGISTVDYFLSSDLIELKDARSRYTEKLWLGTTLPTFQQRIAPPPDADRGEFELPADARLYACLQNPMKLHPDSDALFSDILRRDPQGLLLLLSGKHARVAQQLQERMQATMPDVVSRIKIFPWQPPPRYLRLLSLADVVLDPPHFSAGLSSYDVFSLNLPIIALPGTLSVSRYTTGCYRKMEIERPIASSHQQYVETAVRTATNRDFRRQIVAELASATPRLFADAAAIENHEQFFTEVLESK